MSTSHLQMTSALTVYDSYNTRKSEMLHISLNLFLQITYPFRHDLRITEGFFPVSKTINYLLDYTIHGTD